MKKLLAVLALASVTMGSMAQDSDVYKRQPLWALTDSNRRPSACKADALNQLS